MGSHEVRAVTRILTPRFLRNPAQIESYPQTVYLQSVQTFAAPRCADFTPAHLGAAALERIKLEDGVRVHEATKVDLEVYAQQNGVEAVKPFMLVIADGPKTRRLHKIALMRESFTSCRDLDQQTEGTLPQTAVAGALCPTAR